MDLSVLSMFPSLAYEALANNEIGDDDNYFVHQDFHSLHFTQTEEGSRVCSAPSRGGGR